MLKKPEIVRSSKQSAENLYSSQYLLEKIAENLRKPPYDCDSLAKKLVEYFQKSLELGILPQGMHRVRTNSGVLVMSSFFVDSTRAVLGDTGDQVEKIADFFGTYLHDFRKARITHHELIAKIISELPVSEGNHLRTLTEEIEVNQGNLLVMIGPPGEDSVWEEILGFTAEDMPLLMDALPTYAKIFEYGWVLGSKNHRTDEGGARGHDLLQYLQDKVTEGNYATLKLALRSIGASHEGSHFKLDPALSRILKMDVLNPFYELVAMVLGRDQNNVQSEAGFIEKLINDPSLVNSSSREKVIYHWSMGWFNGVFEKLTIQQGLSERQVVEKIFTDIVKVALSLSESWQEELMEREENTDIFVKKLSRIAEVINALAKEDDAYSIGAFSAVPFWEQMGSGAKV